MVKALFFDIDGTLVSFDTHRMPQSAIDAINKVRESGIKVFIATGRHISAINNLENMVFDGYVTMNGCYCLAGKDQVVFKKSIPQSDIEAYVKYLKEVDNYATLFVEEKSLTVNRITEDVRYLYTLLNFVDTPVNPLYYYRDKEIFQLTAFFNEEQEQDVMKVLPNCIPMRWYPTFADVIASGVDKGVGIDKMGEYFGFTASEVIAFGDGGNDIEMLRHAGIGVAMGNARDIVKKEADYITDTVDNDGIQKALLHFGLI
ncbi:Cof-type HAD-IIB family hydrolase [Dysgonomonas sp. 511]|uniref:Cof-type HAD-IIB family hydrolase n=1 Tax=Dysgonomonas sp. 511 TaxID=2302930 RepID=UPI0013D47FBA|nr:Cof-type HAD-IIB family hydrolase [Dysgonomonas sp. 511]NDV79044.1 Cof-type HAD-IIB family hydrolase [Dysgonomonas sp. 511]